MKQKKRISSRAQVPLSGGAETYKWIVIIILALLLGFFLFMIITRWTDVLNP